MRLGDKDIQVSDSYMSISQDTFNEISKQLYNGKLQVLSPDVICTTNPSSTGHKWVKAYFKDTV